MPLETPPQKELLLFRHAKSDWESGAANDHTRPLSIKGEKAAARMGRLLSKIDQVPDFVLTSSARRAHDTLRIASSNGSWGAPIGVTDALYDTTPSAVLEILRQMPSDYDRVMLVGHEPTWSMLASRLIGGGEIRVPTAAMLRIDFSCENWSAISDGAGQLAWLLPPKHIKKAC